MIKEDKSKDGLSFLKGIAVIFATILTGIIPGVLIMLTTKTNPFEYFETQGNQFAKKTEQFKNQYHQGDLDSSANEPSLNKP